MAAQTITFTIEKPLSYENGEAFGTETLVYMVYDFATDKQLFSTKDRVTKRIDIPDGITCFNVRAAVFNETANSAKVETIGDPVKSCVTLLPPPAKKVGKVVSFKAEK
jgi:hypothetical protein